MRHSQRLPKRSIWGGGTAFRLASMLIMLVIMGMTIVNLRSRSKPPSLPAAHQPRIANQPAGAQTQNGAQPAESDAKKTGTSAGPPDPAELSEFKHDSQVVTDRTATLHAIEMPAYWRLFQWVQWRSLNDLRDEAQTVSFSDLVRHPDRYRGKLIRVDLAVRRVLRYDAPTDNPAGVKEVFEVWGWPSASDGWLYVAVTPELPAGLQVGSSVSAEVTLYGYFFKLQGYQPADAKPNARPLVAPLLVGRLAYAPRPDAAPYGRVNWYRTLGICALILIVVLGPLFTKAWRKRMHVEEDEMRVLNRPQVAIPDEEDAEDDSPSTEGRTPDPDFDWTRDES